MRSDDERTARLVRAAKKGDGDALDELISAYLPLVYNVVGRALSGHSDVDDVVQETMLRVVRSLRSLRDPEKFRSWLLAVTVRQIRDAGRARQREHGRREGLADAADPADPGADFADLSIVRLALSGQRRELAEATQWLDAGDRELLSLWWLEAAGELTRPELAAALGVRPAHAAVRVQRMKAQLEASRAVVRALRTVPRCADLAGVASGWDGRPDALWRKRFARHARDCVTCGGVFTQLVPAERLLTGLALVPVPAVLAGVEFARRAGALGTASTGVAKVFAVKGALASKPLVVGAGATAAVIASVAVAFAVQPADPGPSVPIAEESVQAPATTASPTPSDTPTSPAPGATATKKDPVYGSTVDAVDEAPPVDREPGGLPERPAGELAAVDGVYQEGRPGWIGGDYVMMYRDDHVVIKGKGYFQVRYEIAWFNRPGSMVMPTWTGLDGKLFHVASGGHRRMDDPKPGQPDEYTWMGEPDKGYVELPDGAQQMWQNEFFYLDGEVTLWNNERGADYNIAVEFTSPEEIAADIETPPNPDAPERGEVRYGLVRDTGDDGCPVPQYLTRDEPDDPAAVGQRSEVRE